jgi:heat-inducible transcriptional repressor
MIEERKRFSELMKKAVPGQTSIIFGEEAQDIAPPGTGFVFHPISVGGKVVGAIGVIGPKRMNYQKVIGMISRLATGLDRMFGEDLLLDDPTKKDGGYNGR